jgi:hypothetical protein
MIFSLAPGLSNQHSMTPEIAVHGFPADNFTQSGSRGINLSRLSFGLELNEPATSKSTSGTSVKFEVGMYPNTFFHCFCFIHIIVYLFFPPTSISGLLIIRVAP